MILYNSNYEFVGISDSCVKKLNFPSFNALKYRVGDDFANIFIEKKGFVSNFKYISWIDYIQQEPDKAKALLKSGDGTYYIVTFDIEPYFFMEYSEKGYLITISSMSEYDDDNLELIIDEPLNIDGEHQPLYVDEEDEYYSSEDDTTQESVTFVFDDVVNESEASFDDKEEKNKKEVEKVDEDISLPPLDMGDFSFDDIQPIDVQKKNDTPKSLQDENGDIISPNDLLAKFGEESLDNQGNSQSKTNPQINKNHNNTQPLEDYLTQNKIDQTVPGDDVDITSKHKKVPEFSTINYNLDEVAQALEIDTKTLLGLLSDFLHHINHMKSFIYDAIERDDIESVKMAIFMVKGLCFNLRIMDIQKLLERVEKKRYGDTAELLKDINRIYQKVDTLNKKFVHNSNTLKFQDIEPKENIANLNTKSIPDFIFQDIVDSFLKLFDSHKENIEESINPEKIGSIKIIIEEMLNIALSLNIDELSRPLKSIYANITSKNIEFDRVVVDWIELSDYVNKLR